MSRRVKVAGFLKRGYFPRLDMLDVRVEFAGLQDCALVYGPDIRIDAEVVAVAQGLLDPEVPDL